MSDRRAEREAALQHGFSRPSAPAVAMRRLCSALRLALVLALSLVLAVRPSAAQSVLRDAETEQFFTDLGNPLVRAAGLSPGNVRFVLIGDKSINAFVAGGQIVYVHSGLIVAADNVNQLQGVIAHELGHVAGGHVTRMGEGAAPATGISLLSLLIGAAAMAMGAGEAGMGVLQAGQTAAMGKFLAFTRNVEASTDSAALRYLKTAGISGRGMMEFWTKLRAEEYRYSSSYADVDPYAMTHPRPRDRAAIMEADLRGSPYWDTKPDPALEARFRLVKAKLKGFVDDPKTTIASYPESDQSAPARYARAYAWHRGAYPDRAVQEVEKLVAAEPANPWFKELKGQILLESGRPTEAVPVLRQAVAGAPDQPLVAALLGHALIATEDRKNFEEARRVLKLAVARDNENPFAWYQLGIVYDREGDRARAALATAERYNLQNQPRLALASAQQAMGGIPQGTPDFIRAQDIAMVSRTAVEDQRRRR